MSFPIFLMFFFFLITITKLDSVNFTENNDISLRGIIFFLYTRVILLLDRRIRLIYCRLCISGAFEFHTKMADGYAKNFLSLFVTVSRYLLFICTEEWNVLKRSA